MPEIEENMLTIFSQRGCVQCVAAERHAKLKKIPYQKIDVTESQEAYDLVTGWGYKKAPVLYYKGEHTGGFNPDFINAIQQTVSA